MMREGGRKRDRVDRIFRETGCHIHVLTPSWLTNGLLLSQARVTARAWPRRVVFPENRLKRTFASTTFVSCLSKIRFHANCELLRTNVVRNRMSNMLILATFGKVSRKNFIFH